ncbi:hypothetical protein J6590_086012 [Homalodisca vitripennis]|nr:hypothetical protein J6590_086012 [Homalodisca vitripennis]
MNRVTSFKVSRAKIFSQGRSCRRLEAKRCNFSGDWRVIRLVHLSSMRRYLARNTTGMIQSDN